MRLRFLFVASILWLIVAQPAHALPKFAREYGVTCQQCHSVPPRLNAFGLAFQANNFNWPGKPPPAHKTGLQALPVSGIVHFSFEDNHTDHTSSTKFRELELFFSDGFRLGGRPGGGYYASTVAATTEED